MTADQPPFRMNQSTYIEPNSPDRARKTSAVQNKQADITVGLCGTSKVLSVVDGA
jgi:hypothetical protein